MNKFPRNRINKGTKTVLQRTLLGGGCLTVLLPASMAFAQSESGSTALEEVVVTAQRRQESMQDVPIAITALSAESLEKAGVTDTFDLKALTPSLNFSTAVGGFGLPRIRGVGSTGTGPGIENPVATYIDGVYITSSSGAMMSLNDIAQVAVLKGPQGTLFGRNATGGLIQITTKKPSHDFSADVQATAGNYGTYGGSTYITGGLSERVAASVAAKYEKRSDGFGVNVNTGNDVMTQELYTARGKLLWDGDNTTITVAGDVSQTKAVNPAFRPLTKNVRGGFAGGGERDIDSDIDPSLKSDQYGASVEIRHRFYSVELMSLSAYRNMQLQVAFDPDGTTESDWIGVPNANTTLGFSHGLVIDNTQIEQQFSQEVQLLSTYEGPLNWVTGMFYMSGDGKFDPGRSTTANAAFLNRYTDVNAKQTLDSYAAFAQGTYSFPTDTNLTAGFRYTRDERELTGIRQTYDRATGQPITPQIAPQGVVEHFKDTFSRPTWRLSVDQRFSPDFMAYASYNRGFRSAAYVAGNVGLNTAFSNKVLKPEIVDAYEVGIKSDLFDNRMRLNAAAYYYDQENVQVMQIVSGIQTVYNADGAELYGIDADLTALIANNLTLTTGFNWTHARYTNFTNASVTLPGMQTPFGGAACSQVALGGNCLTAGDASGKRLQNVPDWTANLGLSYDIPTASAGSYTLTANYYYNDGWPADPDNRVNQDSYGLLDASAMWNSPGKMYSINVWGKNLTDEFYFQQLGASNFADNGVPASPRTYGVTLGVHF